MDLERYSGYLSFELVAPLLPMSCPFLFLF